MLLDAEDDFGANHGLTPRRGLRTFGEVRRCQSVS
jgi:hypothetical protein